MERKFKGRQSDTIPSSNDLRGVLEKYAIFKSQSVKSIIYQNFNQTPYLSNLSFEIS